MGKKVLVVDDMLFMRKTLGKMLEKNGYEVIGEAENGEDAITKYKALKPEIVTMDITMPVMDGLEALKQIMSIDSKANVVIISAVGQESNVMEAIQGGAKNFIVKPFQEEKVVEVLGRI